MGRKPKKVATENLSCTTESKKQTDKEEKPTKVIKRIDAFAQTINMFRTIDQNDMAQKNFVKNSIPGDLFIQLKNMLISVPTPSIQFDRSTVPVININENKEQVETCKHQFVQSEQQVRSSDEMITIFEICKLCDFVK